MTFKEIFLLQAAALVFIGLFGVLTRKNIFRILLSINILQTGVNLFFIALGWVKEGVAPIITPSSQDLSHFVDPLPQALILTSIVIGFGTTALGLVVLIRYAAKHRSLELAASSKNESEVGE